MVTLPIIFLTACSGIRVVDPVVEIQVDEIENINIRYGEELDLDGVFLLVKRESGKTQRTLLKSDMVFGYNKNQLGPQNLSVWYEDCTCMLYVSVADIEVIGLSIKTKPDEIIVTQGSELNLSGVTINVEYDNNTVPQENITKEMIVGYNPNWEPGSHTVFIEYSGQRLPLEITVVKRELISMKINTPPSALQYFVDDVFIPQGLSLLLKYDNGSEQILKYEDMDEQEISFTYNFNISGAANPIILEYKGFRTLPNDLTAVVAEPRVRGLEVTTMPKTKGITINGHNFLPTEITSIVERDQIDWSTGFLTVSYDNGTTLSVDIEKNEVYLYLNRRDGELIPKDYRFNDIGSKKIYVKYGNENVFAEVSINIISKTPYQLSVADIKNKLQRSFIDGERITTDFLRYNILYNNGTYAFDLNDTNSWGKLSESLLADDGSTLDIRLSNAGLDGMQKINFSVGNRAAGFTVRVLENTSTSIKVVEPTRNYVAAGSFNVPLMGSSLYAEMKFGNPRLFSPIPDEYIEYENSEGVVVNSFEEIGEYRLVVKYGGLVEKIVFNVEEYEVKSINLSALATTNFKQFSEIPISTMTMTVKYEVPDGDDIVEDNVSVLASYLYSYDRYKVGKQTITIRYKGCVSDFDVTINPNNVAAIGVCVPPKLVYTVGSEQQLDTEMRIRYVFGDGTYREEELSGVVPSYWTFEGYNLQVAGKQTVRVIRNFGEYSKSFEYQIEVLEVLQSIYEIAFDHTQMGMTQINGQWLLLVGHREDINTRYYVEYVDGQGNNSVATGVLKLQVKYTEAGEYQYIDLKPEYITRASYDKFFDVINPVTSQIEKFRTAIIEYGGKRVNLNIYITFRELLSIERFTSPLNMNYAVGQTLNLNGGVLKATYINDIQNPDNIINYNTYAIIPMTDIFVLTSGYDVNKSVSGSLFTAQNVTIKFKSKETSMSILTYVKVSPLNYIKMSKIAQNYGMVSSPIAVITHSVVNFSAPETHIAFMVNNSWTQNPPSLPGEYQMKLIVTENEYFLGGEYLLEATKFQINKKAIDIQVDYLSKEYGTGDPVFTWRTVNNTFLEPGDQLNIRITREQGENVRFDSFGNVKGYDFYWSFDPNNPGQSDRYIVIPIFDKFVVSQKIVLSGITINFQEVAGPAGIIYNASYVYNNITQTIRSEDLFYYVRSTDELVDSNGDGQLDGLPPTLPGEYYVEVGTNYLIIDEGAGRFNFIIQ